MKSQIFFIMAFTILLQYAYADGGNRFFTLDSFEQTYNLYYKTSLDTIKYINEKGKKDFEIRSTNLTIYDITIGTKTQLFPNGFKEEIITILFETKIDSSGTIMFNNDDYNPQRYIRNNYNISSRELSNKLIIVTFSMETKMFTLWTAHKNGKELKNLKSFSNTDELNIDVLNHCFLFVKSNINQIDIEKIKY